MSEKHPGIEKCPTAIRGLDEITAGGLPRGRPTLICGGAGSGKTLMAMEFIVRGIRDFGEPGIFVAFEETLDDLATNVASSAAWRIKRRFWWDWTCGPRGLWKMNYE